MDLATTNNNSEARHWCLTVNNPTFEDRARFVASRDKIDYYCLGDEFGEDGTPHIQGYIAFKKKIRFNALKKLYPRAHLEVKRGTVSQAIEYCKKDGNFTEYGVIPEEQTVKGHKKSLEIWNDTRTKALEGRINEVNSEHFIKYYSTLKKVSRDLRNRTVPSDLTWKEGKPPNQWIYGPTGTGKSHKARAENPGFYIKMNNKWWESYDDEEVVLIEDVGKTHEWMGDFLKIWADRYGFRAEIKYDSAVLRPKKIVVTSNYHPKDLWPDPSIHEPLLRRFKLIHLEKLEQWDKSGGKKVGSKRARREVEEDVGGSLGPAYLYRQNADGNLERWTDRQPVIDDFTIVSTNPLSAAQEIRLVIEDSASTESHI